MENLALALWLKLGLTRSIDMDMFPVSHLVFATRAIFN